MSRLGVFLVVVVIEVQVHVHCGYEVRGIREVVESACDHPGKQQKDQHLVVRSGEFEVPAKSETKMIHGL